MSLSDTSHVIGVMPLWDDKKDSIWMLPGYFEGIEKAGGIPIMLPFTDNNPDIDQLVSLCDGFLFTGGHDVSPEVNHEEKMEGTYPCQKRDRLETVILNKAIEEDKPILGKCILVIPVTIQDKDNVRWATVTPETVKPRKISCVKFTKLLYESWDWNPNMAYKVEGKVVTANKKVMLLFDFSKAEYWKCAKKIKNIFPNI